MVPSTIRAGMGRKRRKGDKPPVIYLEVTSDLKSAMEDLAQEHDRALTGECVVALKKYLAEHDMWPPRKSACAEEKAPAAPEQSGQPPTPSG